METDKRESLLLADVVLLLLLLGHALWPLPFTYVFVVAVYMVNGGNGCRQAHAVSPSLYMLNWK